MGVYACKFMGLSGGQRPTLGGVSMELYTLVFFETGFTSGA